MVKELRGGAKNPSLNCNNRDTEQYLGFTLRMTGPRQTFPV